MSDDAELKKFHAQLDEKIEDDKDFLSSYGNIRTPCPSTKYKNGWDRIWGNRSSSPDPS